MTAKEHASNSRAVVVAAATLCGFCVLVSPIMGFPGIFLLWFLGFIAIGMAILGGLFLLQACVWSVVGVILNTSLFVIELGRSQRRRTEGGKVGLGEDEVRPGGSDGPTEEGGRGPVD